MRNAAALALARLVTMALLFGWQGALTRWLGPSGYGVYATIGAMLALAAVLPELGMGLVVVRDVARHPGAAGRYLAATLVLQPLLGVVAYGGVLLAGTGLGFPVDVRALLVLAALSLVIDPLGTMCHNQLLAEERMGTAALIGVGHAGLLVALGTAAGLAGAGLWGIYTATLAAGCARAVAYGVTVWRGGRRPEFPLDRAVVRGLLTGGLPLAATALLTLAHVHADKLVTAALLGTVATGHLAAGQLVSFGTIELLSTTALVAVLPGMARAALQDRDRALVAMVERLAFLTMTAALPVAACASLLLAPMAERLFGPGFAPTGAVLRVLPWATAATMTGNVFAQALFVENRQTRLLGIRAIGLGLSLGSAVVLLPRLGVVGAPVASLLAESVVLALLLRAFPLPVARWAEIGSRVGRLGVAGLSLVGLLLIAHDRPLVAGAVGLASYALLLRGLDVLTARDRDILRGLARAIPGLPAAGRRRREPV